MTNRFGFDFTFWAPPTATLSYEFARPTCHHCSRFKFVPKFQSDCTYVCICIFIFFSYIYIFISWVFLLTVMLVHVFGPNSKFFCRICKSLVCHLLALFNTKISDILDHPNLDSFWGFRIVTKKVDNVTNGVNSPPGPRAFYRFWENREIRSFQCMPTPPSTISDFSSGKANNSWLELYLGSFKRERHLWH